MRVALVVAVVLVVAVLAALAAAAVLDALQARFVDLVTFAGSRCMSPTGADECADVMRLGERPFAAPAAAQDLAALIARFELGMYHKRPELYTAVEGGDGPVRAQVLFAADGDPIPLALSFVVGGHMVLVCRGTANAADWAQNVKYDQEAPFPRHSALARVHAGFLFEYRRIEAEFAAALETHRPAALTVVGHSMGCGVAALCAAKALLEGPPGLRAVAGLLLASPRVGNPEFAELLRPARLVTVVNVSDPIPSLPPVVAPAGLFRRTSYRYAHVGLVRAFNEFGPTVLNTHGLYPYWRFVASAM